MGFCYLSLKKKGGGKRGGSGNGGKWREGTGSNKKLGQ